MTTKLAPPGGYLKADGDGDNDDDNGHQKKGTVNDDVTLLSYYGGTAPPADRQAITAVIKRYYAAAVAEDGMTACSLLHSSVALALAKGQSQATQAGKAACAAALAPLLKQQHKYLVAIEVPTMVVPVVHAKGDLGLAVLGFRSQPEGEILVEREGRAWKLGALLDSELT